MENFEFTNENEAPKRPVFLTVLCALTFIGSGFVSIVTLIIALFADEIVEMIQSDPNYNEELMAEKLTVFQAGTDFYLTWSFLALGSLAGAVLMWKLKKVGFHVYAISNLIILFIPMLMVGTPINWGALVMTTFFITMYAVNLKLMK